jgi:predicted peptidase
MMAPRHLLLKIFPSGCSDDPWVPVEGSRTMVKALKAQGARVKYEGADHFIWERTYTDKKVIDFWTCCFRQ